MKTKKLNCNLCGQEFDPKEMFAIVNDNGVSYCGVCSWEYNLNKKQAGVVER